MKDPNGLSFSFLCAIAALRETHYSHARCAQAAKIAKDQPYESLLSPILWTLISQVSFYINLNIAVHTLQLQNKPQNIGKQLM